MGYSYLYANDDGVLIIGDNCSLNTNVQLGAAAGKIVIGNNVMIAPNVVLRAANHGSRRATEMRLQPHEYGEIVIEDDVWIGSNAVITSGVTIARGTLVGAGAVVTKSTTPYSIVGGVPARVIGERR
jgi:galactoside O-acetyltransferase